MSSVKLDCLSSGEEILLEAKCNGELEVCDDLVGANADTSLLQAHIIATAAVAELIAFTMMSTVVYRVYKEEEIRRWKQQVKRNDSQMPTQQDSNEKQMTPRRRHAWRRFTV